MSTEEIAKIPRMDLAQHLFAAKLGGDNASASKEALLAAIKTDNMAPMYQHVCEELKQPVDQKLLSSMQAQNKSELERLDAKLADAEKNAGETEISDALIAKAEYLAKIGAKSDALSAFRVAFEKTPGVGAKIDLVFSQIRIGLFFVDADVVTRNLEKAKSLIEQGGDWDRRNRCKVYEGTWLMSQRDFNAASKHFLDGLSTFTSVELMEYKDFVKYTVLTSLISLPRPEIKKKLLEAPEVLEVVNDVPYLDSFMQSLYHCQYSKFFEALTHMEAMLRNDRYLHTHYRFYVREMRIIAYSQLLESYRSLTLESMANAFGVSEGFIDRELSKFIAGGRLNCVIDKVGGVVETNRPDSKNAQYQSTIKQGDLLLNRIQKLSRVINV
ncbi:proteasome regulatory particle subunit [Sorochytrium milnesiophthora]